MVSLCEVVSSFQENQEKRSESGTSGMLRLRGGKICMKFPIQTRNKGCFEILTEGVKISDLMKSHITAILAPQCHSPKTIKLCAA